MAEWIGGLLSGLPTWLVVIILIIIFMAMIAFFPCTYGYEPFWPFRRRKK